MWRLPKALLKSKNWTLFRFSSFVYSSTSIRLCLDKKDFIILVVDGFLCVWRIEGS